MSYLVGFYKMKQKLSVTVDKDVIKRLESLLNGKKFRNKSHIVELALSEWLGEEE